VLGQSESQQIAHVDPSSAYRAARVPVFTSGSEGDLAYLPDGSSSSVMAAR
jgi:hypothetical protein